MIIEVLGKEYEVIEIIPKKCSEHDLFICKAPAGYRECFQRCDIGRTKKVREVYESVAWTCEEVNIIKEAIKNGVPLKEIAKNEQLNRHTVDAAFHKATQTRRAMIWKKQMEQEKISRPRFKVRF